MCASCVQDAAQGGDLDRQIVLFDDGSRPDGGHDVVFRDQLPLAGRQQSEQIERARTERNRNGVAGVIEPEQATAVEAEAFEKQSIARPEHRAARFPAIST